MTQAPDEQQHVQMVPVDAIRVLNPRSRNQQTYKQIVSNIAKVGLKKPITISVRGRCKGPEPKYDLICGQGRLEAFKALGETVIPAIVVKANKEERLLMSLVENIARRHPSTIEQVKEIAALKERGSSAKEISRKTGLSEPHVRGVLRLWKSGELRLLDSVERGRVPLTVAMLIAETEDDDLQRALTEAYESGKLKGAALLKARKLAEKRQVYGKDLKRQGKHSPKPSADALVKAYQQEVARQKDFIKRARICETQLTFLKSALTTLLGDANFATLLRAEGLASMPKVLAEQLSPKR